MDQTDYRARNQTYLMIVKTSFGKWIIVAPCPLRAYLIAYCFEICSRGVFWPIEQNKNEDRTERRTEELEIRNDMKKHKTRPYLVITASISKCIQRTNSAASEGRNRDEKSGKKT